MKVMSIVIAGLLLCSGLTAQDAKLWERLVKEASLSMPEAIDRGLKEAGKGFVYQAELEMEAGTLVYSIDIWQGKGGANVVLNAKTGKVFEKSDEPNDVSKAVGACKIDLKQAIAAALKRGQRTILETKLVLKAGKPVVLVRTLAGGAFETLAVDGVTGALSGVKEEEPPDEDESDEFQKTFAVDKADLVPHGKNPFFILEPGWQLTLEGKEGKDAVSLVITILQETRKIDGVQCAILEERETENGQLAEISRNFFAISKRTNAVYYFGEEVDDYKDGKIVSHGGEWESGKKGAIFGLFMPGTPLVGARYYNEHAPRVALDRVEILDTDQTVETTAGTFKNCVRWRETTPLEPKVKDYKAFAPGIGFVVDGPLRLVKYGKK